MKIKTSELTGPALRWAAAVANGYSEGRASDVMFCDSSAFDYAESWAKGGPIIEREKLNITADWQGAALWHAWQYVGGLAKNGTHGPTPLIAAMRCFVASKLGDEVEVPEELV